MSAETPRERPILFNDQMVRAILEGRKTVTRRAVKGLQIPTEDKTTPHEGLRWSALGQRHLRYGFNVFGSTEEECAHELARCGICPFGKSGDRLWVREAWTIDLLAAYSTEKGYDSEYEVRYRADDAAREIHVAPGEPDPYLALYDSQRGDWRPSIHMPRWASRILLEITDVRVERLQDGEGETDYESRYVAEGVNRIHHGDGEYYYHAFQNEPGPGNWCDPFDAWRELWVSINGIESWAGNPWVWVIEFKRVTP
ncbi:hypothetical protein ACKWWR_001723 [Pseudomonas aeruginosa]|uniref:hypothetical protein n=1 Tax=Pseudomonas aeruginosa TaxID=287 RepID=UPI0009850187|nr:hypothetical protein [Pseudomonas aeruginosa]EKC1487639.1 hypothetical protein [Pseudomonas aeruginosa]EKT8088912.1 hypothetical protein [Pseudomonas aeruginosa]EKT8458143.1 hypothetical protein [Pseudomonas aeruginosa]EKU0564112.1 hypothetical protein [Pseudomonas aeruginosa]EKU3639351.1 hypothetical protein [Pseudomonas aeruginosa]